MRTQVHHGFRTSMISVTTYVQVAHDQNVAHDQKIWIIEKFEQKIGFGEKYIFG